jgi:XTP/dITP diphosphohydrolase
MAAAAGWTPCTLTDAGVAERDDEEAVEAFATFEENAVAKARYYRARLAELGAAPDAVVLADDSGIEVMALGGAPGVRSKRWSGSTNTGAALDADNNAFLLAQLGDAPDRSARYVCVAALCDGAGRIVTARGESAGHVLHAPRGTGGFGYDPYVHSADLGMSFAEATPEAKAVVSHRGRAMRAVLAKWSEVDARG